MLPSLRLAVELPPVPGRADTVPMSLEPWWQMTVASVRAGAGVVWFTGGRTVDSTGHAPACDACTIAAGAISLVDSALFGVVSAVPVDRHPAVLARDVTTLDIVSGGRAAVMLRWAGTAPTGSPTSPTSPTSSPGDLPGACAYLGEAVAVCRSVLQDDDPVFEGRYLHVAGAVNRPPPRRPGGPPLLVEVPAGAAGLARREAGSAFLLREASSAAAAIVCPDDPGEIASWRALLDDAAAALWGGYDRDRVPAVVCRTTLRSVSTEPATRATRATRVSTPATRATRASTRATRATPARTRATPATTASTRTEVRARLEAARAAGADGVIVRMPSNRRGDEPPHIAAPDAERIGADLAECFEPWER